MVFSKAKLIAAAAVIAAMFGLQQWGMVSARNTLEDRISAMETELQSVRETSAANVTQVASDLGVVTEKMGVTQKDLDQARKVAEQLRQEQARTAKGLRQEIATTSEAATQAVTDLRQEATTKLSEVQSEANSKIGVVTGDVQNVRVDLDSTKSDLANSRREMGDMRDALGRDIARNSSELAELRRRGERDYIEFDVRKSKDKARVGEILLQLKKADTKAKKYDLVMLVNDANLEKKGQPINEPIQFLVGKDRLRYELVVYSIDKDRIRGYISTPKDRVLSAEGPKE